MKASTASVYYSNGMMNAHSQRIVNYARTLLFGWTVLIGLSCWWSVREHNHVLNKIALAQARATIGRDLLYRRWGTGHGGVYVPPTEKTPPNPYLAHIPHRDVVTTGGQKLTLINPAYMTRQVYELAQATDKLIATGHLTSLNPLNPQNAPDAWEKQGLQSFTSANQEVSEIVQLDGQSYMRLMKPFVTDKPCLKCHAFQGYKVGDIRGALSVNLPIQPLVEASINQIYGTLATHGAIWLLGMGVTLLGAGQLSRSALIQQEIEEELHLQARQLEDEIAERQAAQEQLQDQASILEEEITERQAIQESLFEKQHQLELLNQTLENRISETISDLRQKDQILIQQGRLAAMGEMINNIAHQWRQPLNNIGLIIQNLQFAFQANTLSHQEFEHEIENVMSTILHMSHTIDDFRNFFRQDKEQQAFLIHTELKRSIDYIDATLEVNSIQLTINSDQTVSAIGYPNEYAQVLLNILTNARDVLVERSTPNPEIRITVSSEDNRSVVTISDNGGGICDEILPKVFDPYFTTKEPGKGTGIGLYMSKTIIEQHMNGLLTAYNILGGVEFRIEL